MKLTVQRECPVQDVEPDEIVIYGGERWEVDEIQRTREGWVLHVRAPGSTSSRRQKLTFAVNETVTVEAGPTDRRELLQTFAKMVTVPDNMEAWPFDKDKGVLTIVLGTRITNKVPDRVWTLTFEA